VITFVLYLAVSWPKRTTQHGHPAGNLADAVDDSAAAARA